MIRKDTPMDQKSVITVKDITAIALKERRPGCEKGTLHDNAPVQTQCTEYSPAAVFQRTSMLKFTIFLSA
jgi:hypothetical protein